MKKPPDLKLTKADTVALWYAADWMGHVLTNWLRDGFKDAQDQANYEAERAKLARAKRALRKVNAIRKAGVDPRQRSPL